VAYLRDLPDSMLESSLTIQHAAHSIPQRCMRRVPVRLQAEPSTLSSGLPPLGSLHLHGFNVIFTPVIFAVMPPAENERWSHEVIPTDDMADPLSVSLSECLHRRPLRHGWPRSQMLRHSRPTRPHAVSSSRTLRREGRVEFRYLSAQRHLVFLPASWERRSRIGT
jgi:hypothetical protein